MQCGTAAWLCLAVGKLEHGEPDLGNDSVHNLAYFRVPQPGLGLPLEFRLRHLQKRQYYSSLNARAQTPAHACRSASIKADFQCNVHAHSMSMHIKQSSSARVTRSLTFTDTIAVSPSLT